jgi:hypothetical protein
MKIKLTESQAKRLKLINENYDEISRFEEFCETKVKLVDKYYVRVSFITIAEILNKEVNFEVINEELNAIEREISQASEIANDYVESLSEELFYRVRNAEHKVMDKLTSLQLITMDLETLQSTINKHNLSKPFKDVKVR